MELEWHDVACVYVWAWGWYFSLPCNNKGEYCNLSSLVMKVGSDL